jgi:hypothetical protein
MHHSLQLGASTAGRFSAVFFDFWHGDARRRFPATQLFSLTTP